MKPEEIESLADRLEKHNRWRRGDPVKMYTSSVAAAYAPVQQLGLDLDAAVELLRGLARDRIET